MCRIGGGSGSVELQQLHKGKVALVALITAVGIGLAAGAGYSCYRLCKLDLPSGWASGVRYWKAAALGLTGLGAAAGALLVPYSNSGLLKQRSSLAQDHHDLVHIAIAGGSIVAGAAVAGGMFALSLSLVAAIPYGVYRVASKLKSLDSTFVLAKLSAGFSTHF